MTFAYLTFYMIAVLQDDRVENFYHLEILLQFLISLLYLGSEILIIFLSVVCSV